MPHPPRRRGRRYPGPSKRFVLSLPPHLLEGIEMLAEKYEMSRNEAIRDAIRMRLLLEHRQLQKEGHIKPES